MSPLRLTFLGAFGIILTCSIGAQFSGWQQSAPIIPVAASAGKSVPEHMLQDMGKAIRLYGFACNTPIAGFHYQDGPYGMEIRFTCETGDFQVIARPDNTMSVRTWATRLK